MSRRRLMMIQDESLPYFRLGFSNGLTPEISPEGVSVSTSGSVTVNTGNAYINSGQIDISPTPLLGNQTVRIKYMLAPQRTYTSLYATNGFSGSTRKGFGILRGTSANYSFLQFLYQPSYNKTISLPTDTSYLPYDLVFTVEGTSVNVYRNGALIAADTIPHIYDASSPNMTSLGYNYSSPYGYQGYFYLYEIYNRVLSADEILKLYNDAYDVWYSITYYPHGNYLLANSTTVDHVAGKRSIIFPCTEGQTITVSKTLETASMRIGFLNSRTGTTLLANAIQVDNTRSITAVAPTGATYCGCQLCVNADIVPAEAGTGVHTWDEIIAGLKITK